MSTELEELYQEVILDHSRRPRNFGTLPNADVLVHGDNPACGDEIHLGVHFSPDGKLEEIKFSGQGCAISQASASLMTDMLVGRSVDEAEQLMGGFLHLVKGEDTNGLAADDRERLDVMAGVSAFPMRVKCATLAWHTMKSALEGGPAPAKTE